MLARIAEEPSDSGAGAAEALCPGRSFPEAQAEASLKVVGMEVEAGDEAA